MARLSADQHLAKVKTQFARWFDGAGIDPKLRARLLKGVEAMLTELPRRAGWSEAMTSALGNSGKLKLICSGARFQTIPCSDCLAFTTVVPGWGFGWHSIFEDQEVYAILADFPWYARRYIYHSDLAKVLIVAWETERRVLHPFGDQGMSQRHGAVTPSVSVATALEQAACVVRQEWGPPPRQSRAKTTVSVWLNRNTLDPFIHEAIFHFLRAQTLVKHQFIIEAIVAFDCVMETLRKFLTQGSGSLTDKDRAWVCQELGLNPKQGKLANHVYFLRNEFGAHAGGWMWWDQDDFMDDELIDQISDLVFTALNAGADAEPSKRRVDPEPADWAGWFTDNFEVLWKAIWYERFNATHLANAKQNPSD
jgi:hypothetical protein